MQTWLALECFAHRGHIAQRAGDAEHVRAVHVVLKVVDHELKSKQRTFYQRNCETDIVRPIRAPCIGGGDEEELFFCCCGDRSITGGHMRLAALQRQHRHECSVRRYETAIVGNVLAQTTLSVNAVLFALNRHAELIVLVDDAFAHVGEALFRLVVRPCGVDVVAARAPVDTVIVEAMSELVA